MKSWTIHVQIGVPEAIGSNVPNLTKDVPNLMKDIPNFVKDVPRVRIMAHPCSDGGPRSTRLGCTKFNEGRTKFCEGCTKGPKVCSEVGIDPQSLRYRL